MTRLSASEAQNMLAYSTYVIIHPPGHRSYGMRRRFPSSWANAISTDCDDAGDIPPQYCTIPVLSCIVKAYTTLRMCRVLLASAFDLVNPAFSRGRGARRKRDPSMQPHSDIRCVMIRACYVRKLNRRIPFYWMVGTRLDAHYRLRGGLFLPICEPSALLQAAYAIICHVRCVRAASICSGPSGSRHRSNMYVLPC